MDFGFTEEERFFRDSVRKFVEGEIKPRAEEIDRSDEFPFDLFRKVGELGYFGVRYPEEVGGLGGNTTLFTIMIEEFAAGSLGFTASVAMQCLMGTNFLYRFGSESIKERCFYPALRGEKIGTIAFTEPDAGSDLSNIRTVAKKEGDHYVINGTKTWITNATIADFATVCVSTDRSKGLKGLAFILVEKGTPGYSVGKKIEKLGAKGSENCEIFFEDCKVPAENLLGEEGKGFWYLLEILAEIRIMTGALAIGLARAALEDGIRYSKERVAFGKPICKHQLVAEKLARMKTSLEAARLLVYKAAWLKDRNLPHLTEAAMAKYFATETCCMIVDEVTRIYGAYGFAMEYPAQRYFRDARFLLYGGGTHEILKTVIARDITKD